MFYRYLCAIIFSISLVTADQVPEVVASVDGDNISRYELASLLNARYNIFDDVAQGEKEKQVDVIDSLQRSVVFAALEELITLELTKQKLIKLNVQCARQEYVDEAERSERPFYDMYVKWGLDNPISFIESLQDVISQQGDFNGKYSGTLERLRLKFQLTKEDKKELIDIWLDIDKNSDLHNKVRTYVFQKHSITMDNFKKRVKVNAMLRRYIEDNKKQAEIQSILDKDSFALSGGLIRMSHILMLTIDPLTKKELSPEEQQKAYEKIFEVKKKIKSDASNFAQMVKEHSEDDTTKYRDGDLGFVPRWGIFAREIIERGYAMQENIVDGPIKTQFGYHLIMVTEKKPGKKIELKEMQEKATERYISMKKEEILKQWYDAAKIERHLR